MGIKHAKVSNAPEGADSSKVRTSDWNADHTIEAGTITDTHVHANNKDGAANVASMRTLGTSATSAAAGNHNHDGTYATAAHNHDASYAALNHNHNATYAPLPTGVLSDCQISVLQAAHTLAAASGVQACFPAAQDAFTVAANSTYRVTGRYLIATGTTTHTTAMAWALSGATVASFEYLTTLWSAAANTIASAGTFCHVTGVASKVLNATSGAVRTIIEFDGILVTTLGGTITPQINFSANPTGTNQMLRGSHVCFERLGSDVATKFGGWA